MTDAMNEPVPPRPDTGSAASELPPQRPDAGLGAEGSVPPPATWKPIEALPVGLIALGVTAIVGAVAAAFFPNVVSRGPGGAVRESPAFFTLASFIQEAALAGTVGVWILFVNHGRLASLGLPPRRPWADGLVGVVAGVAMVFMAGIVLEVVHSIAQALLGHNVSNPEQVPSDVKGAYLAVSGVVVVGLAPLAEEAFFRGFLYKGLRRRFSVWPAALISASFFGLVHFAGLTYLLIIPSLIVVGVVLALVYERRQSLMASVAAHAVFNLIGFLFIAFGR
ncbi:MAG TPA: type II CAAX endopeptidase family protein [Actinomycetota bacterium]